MSKTPNQEQIKGITHQGGVLLSAGAGSGKTFVLVEHIIYLVKCFIEKENTQGLLDFSKKIKKYFSQIILITYTKKAAGEIRIRVQDRIQKEALESKEKETWMVVLNAADYLHISTIHAFFKKVLAQEYFPNFGRHVDIMTDIEYNDRIKRLFKRMVFDKKERELILYGQRYLQYFWSWSR